MMAQVAQQGVALVETTGKEKTLQSQPEQVPASVQAFRYGWGHSGVLGRKGSCMGKDWADILCDLLILRLCKFFLSSSTNKG